MKYTLLSSIKYDPNVNLTVLTSRLGLLNTPYCISTEGKAHLPIECPGYEIKVSDSEILVLEVNEWIN